MHIRKAQNSDVDKITQLGLHLLHLHNGFDETYYDLEENTIIHFKNWVLSQINSQNSFILVAYTINQYNNQHNIVGFISGFIKYLFPWFKIKKVGHISFMVVDPASRRSGIGRTLEKEAVNLFKTEGVEYVELYVDEINIQGVKAWNSYGYLPFKKFLRKKIT